MKAVAYVWMKYAPTLRITARGGWKTADRDSPSSRSAQCERCCAHPGTRTYLKGIVLAVRYVAHDPFRTQGGLKRNADYCKKKRLPSSAPRGQKDGVARPHCKCNSQGFVTCRANSPAVIPEPAISLTHGPSLNPTAKGKNAHDHL